MKQGKTRLNLIIGSNGLIGGALAKKLETNNNKWVGTYNSRPAPNLLKLDITSKTEVEYIFKELRPAVTYLCSNLAGGVDYCENNPERARDFHVLGTENIGRACLKQNSALVYISTDYLFDDRPYPVEEDAVPSPLNIYGRLKMEAEDWLRKNLAYHYIIRTTNVYGWDPLTKTPNYVMNLIRTVGAGKIFKAPSFLWGNPTYVMDLAEVIIRLVSIKKYNTYHVVGTDYVNRYNWAMKASVIFGLDDTLIEETKEPSGPIVPRPMRLSLNTSRIKKLLPNIIHGLDEGLELMKKEMSIQ